MPKIILINPPSPFLIDDHVFPNLGLMYISAYLKKHGYNPEILDLSGGKQITNINADVIGFYSTTPQYPYVLDIFKKMKEQNPNTLYIIGGPHATCSPETAKYFDISVIGEGERAILRIMRKYPMDYPKFFCSMQIEYIDAFPFPDRDAVDIHSYKYFIDGELATSMMTSRGCPYNCAFCCNIFGRKVRFRTSYNVNLELEELQNKYNYNAVMIYDDEFFLNKKRDIEICNCFKKRKMLWRCFTRSNMVDEKLIETAAKSGLREILLGIESGSNHILKTVNKGTTVEMNREAIRIIRKYGIRVKLAMILGLPSENLKTLQETDDFLGSIEFDDIDFSILQVYPNTDIYKNPYKYDIIFQKGSFFKGRPGHYEECSPIHTSSLTFEEILDARNRLEKKYKKW
jgi:anaerobic magnesium-protoporphyrin IX monomethyl ester cyclase